MKTTASFTTPDVGGSVGIKVDDTSETCEGQTLVIPGIGLFQATTIANGSISLLAPEVPGANAPSGTLVPVGSLLLPSGFLPALPVPILAPWTFIEGAGPQTVTATAQYASYASATTGSGGVTVNPFAGATDGATLLVSDTGGNAATGNITVNVNCLGMAPLVLSHNYASVALMLASGTWVPFAYFPGV